MATSSVNEEATISQPREGGTLFVTAFGTLLRDRRQMEVFFGNYDQNSDQKVEITT